MKNFRIALILAIVSSLASCSNLQNGKRKIASETDGNETGNRGNIEEIQGIVKQVECNKVTGFGAIELQVKNERIIESTWYKVSAPDLCSKQIPSKYFLGTATPLAELAAANAASSDLTISSVKIADGFVVNVEAVKTVPQVKYLKNVERYETKGTNAEVLNWYFDNRKDH